MFYLSILRVYVLMKTSDNSAVNKKAPHNHDGFQNLPQCDLERKNRRDHSSFFSTEDEIWGRFFNHGHFCPLAFTKMVLF